MPSLLPVLCLTAALASAGCGEATDTDDPDENTKPLKVQHALGVSKVPGRAERPVTLYPSELDSALALGSTPVGAIGPLPRYLRARARAVAVVGTRRRPDLARIRSLDPDVILASKPGNSRFYRRLKEIAPTVVLTEGIDWKANFRQDGEALGWADRAERLLARYDQAAARVRRIVRGRLPSLSPAMRRGLRRPFIVSVLDDAGLPRRGPSGPAFLGRPGPDDEWTLGEGYLAALAVLRDIERRAR